MIGSKKEIRNTKQKDYIDKMLDSGEWFNVEDMYFSLKNEGKYVSMATIYNRIGKLYSDGIISQRMIDNKTYFRKI